jgi:multidrug efflux pump subunit AcrA (membrane-fusion protein)
MTFVAGPHNPHNWDLLQAAEAENARLRAELAEAKEANVVCAGCGRVGPPPPPPYLSCCPEREPLTAQQWAQRAMKAETAARDARAVALEEAKERTDAAEANANVRVTEARGLLAAAEQAAADARAVALEEAAEACRIWLRSAYPQRHITDAIRAIGPTLTDAALRRLAEAMGCAVVPVENNDTIRRAVWLAQYEHVNQVKGHGRSAADLAELAEAKVRDPEQRANDAAAWRAMIAAAQAGEARGE